MEGRIEALESDIVGLKADFKDSFAKIDVKLENIEKSLQGLNTDRTSLWASWKTLTVIATIFVSLSGAGVWAYNQAQSISSKIEKLAQQPVSTPKQP